MTNARPEERKTWAPHYCGKKIGYSKESNDQQDQKQFHFTLSNRCEDDLFDAVVLLSCCSQHVSGMLATALELLTDFLTGAIMESRRAARSKAIASPPGYFKYSFGIIIYSFLIFLFFNVRYLESSEWVFSQIAKRILHNKVDLNLNLSPISSPISPNRSFWGSDSFPGFVLKNEWQNQNKLFCFCLFVLLKNKNTSYLPISAHATTLSSRAVINNAYCSAYLLFFSVSTYIASKRWTSKSSLHSAVAVEEWCQAKFSSTSKITDWIFPLPILPNVVSDEGL